MINLASYTCVWTSCWQSRWRNWNRAWRRASLRSAIRTSYPKARLCGQFQLWSFYSCRIQLSCAHLLHLQMAVSRRSLQVRQACRGRKRNSNLDCQRGQISSKLYMKSMTIGFCTHQKSTEPSIQLTWEWTNIWFFSSLTNTKSGHKSKNESLNSLPAWNTLSIIGSVRSSMRVWRDSCRLMRATFARVVQVILDHRCA